MTFTLQYQKDLIEIAVMLSEGYYDFAWVKSYHIISYEKLDKNVIWYILLLTVSCRFL